METFFDRLSVSRVIVAIPPIDNLSCIIFGRFNNGLLDRQK